MAATLCGQAACIGCTERLPELGKAKKLYYFSKHPLALLLRAQATDWRHMGWVPKEGLGLALALGVLNGISLRSYVHV